jgi:hypothetical protein
MLCRRSAALKRNVTIPSQGLTTDLRPSWANSLLVAAAPDLARFFRRRDDALYRNAKMLQQHADRGRLAEAA